MATEKSLREWLETALRYVEDGSRALIAVEPIDSEEWNQGLEFVKEARAALEKSPKNVPDDGTIEKLTNLLKSARQYLPEYPEDHSSKCPRTSSCDLQATNGCDEENCPKKTGSDGDCCERHEHRGCPECECAAELVSYIDTVLAGLAEPKAEPLSDSILELKAQIAELQKPIPMTLFCPVCHARHIDKGIWATKIHHTHSCQVCGISWRPAVVATIGVQFLPGFKNE